MAGKRGGGDGWEGRVVMAAKGGWRWLRIQGRVVMAAKGGGGDGWEGRWW